MKLVSWCKMLEDSIQLQSKMGYTSKNMSTGDIKLVILVTFHCFLFLKKKLIKCWLANCSNEYETCSENERHSKYCYDMCHKKRGLALIFNHEHFNRQRRRRGTHIDRDRLRDTFKSLDFKVKIYEDKTKAEILTILQKGVQDWWLVLLWFFQSDFVNFYSFNFFVI